MKHKIVFVHHGRILGGAPVSLRNTLLELKRVANFELSVLCAHKNMCSFFKDSAGVESKVISHPRLIFGRVLIGWASIFNIRTFIITMVDLLLLPISIIMQYRDLKREHADIVHLNSSILFSTAVAARLVGLPVIWHVREVLVGGKYNLTKNLAGWLIRNLADEVICISPAEARSLGKNKRNNVNVVYNFINLSKFRYDGIDIEKEKERLGISKDNKVVLSLGGVSFRKGAFEIVESCQYLPDNYTVLIAGPPLAEIRKNTFERIIYSLLLKAEDLLVKTGIKSCYVWLYNFRVWKSMQNLKNNKPIFLGKHKNVVPLLAVSDLLVFAGRTPHFPRPVYEAWAMKKPVVVYDMEGVSQNISDGNDGLIVRRPDAQSLADGIKKVLGCDKTAEKMGRQGYPKSVNTFDAEKNIMQIVRIYGSLLSSNTKQTIDEIHY